MDFSDMSKDCGLSKVSESVGLRSAGSQASRRGIRRSTLERSSPVDQRPYDVGNLQDVLVAFQDAGQIVLFQGFMEIRDKVGDICVGSLGSAIADDQVACIASASREKEIIMASTAFSDDKQNVEELVANLPLELRNKNSAGKKGKKVRWSLNKSETEEIVTQAFDMIAAAHQKIAQVDTSDDKNVEDNKEEEEEEEEEE
ncbi:hypothetical protein EJ03DRAFT_339629 [Teratosphaeria nubilosa]|uniref:Uncharacterized protein n=1 Tax=Teratosphaeria nubilosa TaxID=161662 RepID=A0A6G1KW61_9PEZI|nr:hypothetical protein EJ03DRAFT_339629 [Teratosphaeria nubilosa]